MRVLFHARSPLWQFLVSLMCIVMLTAAVMAQEENGGLLGLVPWVYFLLLGLLVLLTIAYLVVMFRHNAKHPDDKIRNFGFTPPELKEEDEGMLAFTSRATRRVYVFHSCVLPLMAIVVFLLDFNPYVVIASFGVLLFGHLLTYWISIWPVWREEIEGEE